MANHIRTIKDLILELVKQKGFEGTIDLLVQFIRGLSANQRNALLNSIKNVILNDINAKKAEVDSTYNEESGTFTNLDISTLS